MGGKRVILALALFMWGCTEDAPTHESFDKEHEYKQLQLISVEGGWTDQWEIWKDTVSGARILCHHSGSSGSYGGRSTSCFVVSVEKP